MRFSIITPSFGQGAYIRQNIESVLRQRHPDVEHIVIDGGSTDETVDILNGYPHLRWVSERDEGQADALAKGLGMANGEIVGWINSDDYYFEAVFERVAEAFKNPAVQWVIGNISLLDETTGEIVPRRSPEISWESLQRNPDIVRQQGTFFRRSFLREVGGWNKNFYMVMDFDLWVRLAKRSKPLMIDEQFAVFRIQKDQKSGIANIRRQTKELTQVLKRENANSIIIWQLKLKKEWQLLKGVAKTWMVRAGVLDKHFLLKPVRGWRSEKP